MVAKIVEGKSIRGILRYNEDKVQKSQAKILLASGFATEIERLNFHQKLYRFETLHELSPKIKCNAMHITLNFHPQDELDAAKMQQITAEYMNRIGFGEQTFIAYAHFDAAHPHIHIATSRIQRNSKPIFTNKIGWRLSEPARKAIEENFGLIKAQGRSLGHEGYLKPARYSEKPTSQQLASITKSVMEGYAYTSFAEFKAVLAQFNVHAERGAEESEMFKNKGLLYFITDAEGRPVGVPFKASSFYQGATMKRIEKRFEGNKVKRAGHKQDLQSRIEMVLTRYSKISRPTLIKELALDQIALVLRQNEQGRIYGITFIDHRNKAVFNGSDLGRIYSASRILSRLSEKDETREFLSKTIDTHVSEKHPLSTREQDSPDGLLESLLAKADFDPMGELSRKRKRKKSKGQSPSQNL